MAFKSEEIRDALDRIYNDDNVRGPIVAALVNVWGNAYKDEDSDCAPGHMASIGYLRGIKMVSKALRLTGGEKENKKGQIRFFWNDRYPNPVQFILSKGEQEPNGFVIPPKGIWTEQYLQMSLFEEEYPSPVERISLWIIIEPTRGSAPNLKIYLAAPIDMTEGNTRLRVQGEDYRTLFDGPMFGEIQLPKDLPQSLPVDVIVEDLMPDED